MIFNFDTSYLKLPSSLYSIVTPTEGENPKLLILNKAVMADLDIPLSDNLDQIFSGNELQEPAIAQAYAGHQFGHFNMLGDGRALLLGEQITKDGRRVDIQLKGSGKTPYSRGGDGKATISSMLREYLYGAAMTQLGIKSSQSLAVLSIDEAIYREPIQQRGILVRTMSSHIRIGTFEYLSFLRPKEELTIFTNYVIDRHYNHLNNEENRYLMFFEAVMDHLIDMVINWYRVGFIHGVMNTDNMSITGETFDYGPCAFMNRYDPDTVFSSIDRGGRYAFGNQKKIVHWNLFILAKALHPIIDPDPNTAATLLEKSLQQFEPLFYQKFDTMMKAKLGIAPDRDAKEMIDDVISWMSTSKADYTNTFIELLTPRSFSEPCFQSEGFIQLREKLSKIGLDEALMKKNNPSIIPRNNLVERALSDYVENRELSLFNELLTAMKNPYDYDQKDGTFQRAPDNEYDLSYQTFCNT